MRVFAIAVVMVLAATPAVAALSRSSGATAEPASVATGPGVLLTIAANGSIRVDSVLVRGDAAVLGALKAAVARGKTEVTIACDKSRPYGEVVHVMDLCKQAGLTRIAFAVAP